MLCYQCVGVRHMILDCAQAVLHMLQCIPVIDPDGLVIPC